MKPRVVVGVDGSDESIAAARWAAGLAVPAGAGVRLVSAVSPFPTSRHPAAAAHLAYLQRAAEKESARILAQAAAVVGSVAPELDVVTDAIVAEPVRALERASTDALMVVVGAIGRSGLAGLLAGSTATRLPTCAHAPVVVVRLRPAGGVADSGPVVVGVAGAEFDDAAIGFAFFCADLFDTGVIAAHAWADVPLQPLDPATGSHDDWIAIRDREKRLIHRRLEGHLARYPDVPVRVIVAYDEPAQALIEQARTARMLVVGSRGRGRFTGAVLGSTSRAVLKLSDCPVAVVRNRD